MVVATQYSKTRGRRNSSNHTTISITIESDDSLETESSVESLESDVTLAD